MDRLSDLFDILKNIMQMLSVWDILDMTIVAFLIYHMVLFFSKTNSMNVVKGIFLLLAMMLLTTIGDMPVLSYLLGNAFEMGLLVVVVIFQPEIRRMLEQAGGSIKDIFGHPVRTKSIENAIAQTVLACTDMSASRTGALLVFERTVNLDSYIKTGTIVDAAPAAELLKNLFYDKAPLHDGAVIIREARVAGAACMLPLSGNQNISRDLGMRHRAGIGMSERSDAVVAIVSEETGDISIAMEGMLKRGLTPATFEQILRNELMPVEPEKKGLLGAIKKHVGAAASNDRTGEK